MIISIASGKGGTGKTTVATNLALSLGEGVRLLDCDVEEPNCHLFLHPQINETEIVTSFIPVIRDELCTGCKKCADICRFRALTVVRGKVLVFPELCHSCGGCLEVCPENAVVEGSREIGVMESGWCGSLGIPCGLVINRSDMGDDGVKHYAHREKIPVLLEIPFDRKIAEAYSRGTPIVEIMPEWVQRFRGLYEHIVKLAGNGGKPQ